MFDYQYKDLFFKDSTDKQLHIYYDNRQGHLTNVDLHSQEFNLQESICSDSQLHFGSCESSCLSFKIANKGVSLKGKTIQVEMVIGGHTENPLSIGTYIVDSDVPTADRYARTITAYDALYKVINADVLAWYNFLPNAFTLKAFRDSFFSTFGIVQDSVTLPNDGLIINKVELNDLSGKQVLEAICELNGCFGHINRNNIFKYVYLSEIVEGLYPRNDLYPKNDLYPVEEIIGASINKQHYISVDYEDYTVAKIDKIKIWDSSNNQLAEYGPGTNIYDIENNVLAYGLTQANAISAMSNMFPHLNKIWYMPIKSVQAVGNPCMEVGDSVRLNTSDKIIYTYVLERTISGIQALKDSFSAGGEEYRIRDVNSLENKINNVASTTELLKSDIEETNLNLDQTNLNLADTNSTVSSHTTQIGGLTTTVDSQGRTINTLSGDINNINGNINNITGDINNINGNINNITGDINNINGRINTISGDVTNIEGGVANLNTAVTNLNSDITNVSGRVFNVESAVTNIDSDVTNINSEVVNINGSITNINSAITNMNEVIATKISASYINATNINACYQGTTALRAKTVHTDRLWVDFEGVTRTFNPQRLTIGGKTYILLTSPGT